VQPYFHWTEVHAVSYIDIARINKQLIHKIKAAEGHGNDPQTLRLAHFSISMGNNMLEGFQDEMQKHSEKS
jgi:hypothetical protein